MPRKKHLINVHTSTGTTAPTGASLYLGEIAVQHTPNDPALWIKVGTDNTSTEYEKFIGQTEIVSLIENADLVLGSGYTYSGIPYVNSATSISDAYSAATDILLTLSGTLEDDECIIAAAFNDINGKIIALSGNSFNPAPLSAAVVNVADGLDDLSGETIGLSGAVMAISASVADIKIDMILGSGYTYSGLPYVNSATQIADAYSAATDILLKLSGTVEDDEYAIAAAFNDVNDRIDELSGNSFNPAPLSASVVSNQQNITVLSAATTGLSEDLGELSASTTGLSGAVVAISAAMADIKVDMILGSGYTYSAIPYVNSATQLADAYSALTNEFIKTERAAAEAMNDLNDRIIELSASTGAGAEPLSAAVISLSAAVVTISGNSGAGAEPLSASVISLSAGTVAISNNLASLSGGAESKITVLSGATTAHTATTIPNGTSSQMHLPVVSASDNGKILRIVNGAWTLVDPVTIYNGTTAPDAQQGQNGDIYLQF